MKIRKNLKEDRDRKKSYMELKRIHNKYKVWDHVYLRATPRKSSLKLRNYGKLEPRSCGPFEVLDRLGPITYRIGFPTNMIDHNVFHVSFLKRYVHDPNHLID